MLRSIIDILFPRRCPFCGAAVGKELLCGSCRNKLEREAPGVITLSGTECAAPLYYEDGVRRAILRFKFNRKMGALPCFGYLMAQCAAQEFSGRFDTVTWVPVSRRRLKKRGYDQSQLLARSMCQYWQTKPEALLQKVVDTPAQSGLKSPEERRANVLGVYETVQPVYGRRILLVDDILTTGATLRECVRVLNEGGAAEVLCLTLARVR